MAERRYMEDAFLENVRIFSTNWDGKKFSKDGRPTFCIALEPEIADKMEADGWKIRRKLARNDEEDDLIFLPATINYDYYQTPRIYTVIDGKKTELTKETLVSLGYYRRDQISKIDVFLHPRINTDQFTGEERVTAYVNTMYVFINKSNPLEEKYKGMFEDVNEIPFE